MNTGGNNGLGNGSYNVVLASDANNFSNGSNSVSIGGNNQNQGGNYHVQIGYQNQNQGGQQSVLIGRLNTTGSNSANCVAHIGHSNCYSQPTTFSLGFSNTIGATGSVAIGVSNTTSHDNAIVLGNTISSEKADTTHVEHIIATGQGASKVNTIGSTGGTVTIDWDNGNNQTITLTSSITSLTLSNPIAGANYGIEVTQGGVGSFTITWPANVKWAGGSAPTLSTGPGLIDFVSLVYTGTDYYGTVAYNFS
jgi:hypothetical protein